MPFYRGRSADGSDMEEVEGVYCKYTSYIEKLIE